MSEAVSLLDRDGERPVVIEPDETSEIVLPLVVLIVFVVFVGIMLFLLVESGFQSTSPEDAVSFDNRSTVGIVCNPGQCATDLFSGFKTCASNDASITVDPSQAVCNSRFVCDNPLTPFALQSDGSTDINGVCEPNTECPCLRYSQCPEYVLSVFTARNGNVYQPFEGQRITFPQESTYVSNTNGNSSSLPPIQYSNPSTTFCAAPPSWLPLSNPGCNFVSAANGNSMDYEDVILCMGMVSGCSGMLGSPCLQGTLAFITNDPGSLTQQNITTSQLGCVAGEPCPCGYAAIFDTNFGDIICRQLPEQ